MLACGQKWKMMIFGEKMSSKPLYSMTSFAILAK
jgi:hypothetical protein